MENTSECCGYVHHGGGPYQTLDEMEWERGLWGAAHEGDLDRVKTLLAKGRYVDERDHSGYTALHYAARNGHYKICEFLLRQGAHVDAATREGHASPLHRAASAGKKEIVELLLKQKASCLLQDADGKTALHRAAEGQHASICEILVDKLPELCDIKDNRGQLPFHYALSQPLMSILKSQQ